MAAYLPRLDLGLDPGERVVDGRQQGHVAAVKLDREGFDYRATHIEELQLQRISLGGCAAQRGVTIQTWIGDHGGGGCWHGGSRGVHHCYMHVLMNSAVFKIIENQNGVAFMKQQQVQMMLPQLMQVGPGALPGQQP